ncbi:MAG: helix-turn-helix domain-containing protein, partial [Phascolarctobacterium sp.]|nr:helix-turn-helix domain-containing protein [Phascolarctobacterium sp.]
MDYQHSITDAEKRKNGKHLTDIDRGTIQALNREGMSLRKIAGHIGCSPSTVLNELRRGTPPRKSNRG